MRSKNTTLIHLTKRFVVRLGSVFEVILHRLAPEAALKLNEKRLGTLDPWYRALLLSMYHGEKQIGTDGKRHPVDKWTRISPTQGMWLYDLCLSVKPKATLEIGMAYGYSTIYFLTAIAKNQFGHHTAIDPFQCSQWFGIGLAHAKAAVSRIGLDSAFHFIEDRSDRAAIDLTRSSSKFEVIFIDGNHRFDDVLVDFYLYAPLCTLGGHIIFDDSWMSSIQTVAAFIRSNRTDFVEIPTDVHNIFVFRKVGEDSRYWKHFRRFAVSHNSD